MKERKLTDISHSMLISDIVSMFITCMKV